MHETTSAPLVTLTGAGPLPLPAALLMADSPTSQLSRMSTPTSTESEVCVRATRGCRVGSHRVFLRGLCGQEYGRRSPLRKLQPRRINWLVRPHTFVVCPRLVDISEDSLVRFIRGIG